MVERVGRRRRSRTAPTPSSTSARAASMRARIQRSSRSRGSSAGVDALRVLEDQPRRRSRACSRACAPPRSRRTRSARPASTRSSAGRSASRRRRTRRSTRSGRCPCRGSSTSAARRRASTVEWMITSRERDVADQLEPGPDHPVLPEADDLAGGRVDVARVVARELRRLVRPAERRERPERRREPRVEDVRIALELGRAALGARRRARPPSRSEWPSGQYQTGIWWPHQSWREMHQSGASSSEAIANRCCDSGW